MQVNKLINDLLARAHTKKVVSETFEEVELKIIEINKRKWNDKILSQNSTLKEVSETIKPGNWRNSLNARRFKEKKKKIVEGAGKGFASKVEDVEEAVVA